MADRDQLDAVFLQACAGDRAAFRDFVLAVQAPLRALAAVRGLRGDQLDDTVQDALVWIWEHRHDYQPGSDPLAWCRAVVRNQVLATLERRRREVRNRIKALPELLLQEVERAHEPEADERLARLERCLQELRPELRDAILGRYRGTPLDELAARARRSIAAFKMLLLRTRKQLRVCVETTS